MQRHTNHGDGTGRQSETRHQRRHKQDKTQSGCRQKRAHTHHTAGRAQYAAPTVWQNHAGCQLVSSSGSGRYRQQVLRHRHLSRRHHRGHGKHRDEAAAGSAMASRVHRRRCSAVQVDSGTGRSLQRSKAGAQQHTDTRHPLRHPHALPKGYQLCHTR